MTPMDIPFQTPQSATYIGLDLEATRQDAVDIGHPCNVNPRAYVCDSTLAAVPPAYIRCWGVRDFFK